MMIIWIVLICFDIGVDCLSLNHDLTSSKILIVAEHIKNL